MSYFSLKNGSKFWIKKWISLIQLDYRELLAIFVGHTVKLGAIF